jgi:predicted  nucleic acid-binding Zn-ribbon protein
VEADFTNLNKLQQLDIDIRNTSVLLDDIPHQIEEIDQKSKESLQIVQNAKESLSENQKKRRDLESKLLDTKENIAKFKRQLNEVKTNKEYTALLKEIDDTNTKIDSLEELIITEMLSADDIETGIKAASKKADEIQAELAEKKEQILQEKNKSEEKLNNLEKEKEELLPKIPSDQMKLYKQLSSQKNRIVLSPVKDEFCAMCHMRVRPQMLNDLIAGREIITCENCGRILQFTKKSD